MQKIDVAIDVVGTARLASLSPSLPLSSTTRHETIEWEAVSGQSHAAQTLSFVLAVLVLCLGPVLSMLVGSGPQAMIARQCHYSSTTNTALGATASTAPGIQIRGTGVP